ncbi:MAG TPA: recombinase RecA [Thermoplasmata archaeon]|nr:recombinase RecA [Thermoplasmata archaeon]
MALTEGDVLDSPGLLPTEADPGPIRKVPTGIADLDSIVDGGFPSGSTVLLLGEIGAGMQEYIYTAASKIALVNERPEARHHYLGDHCDASDLPTKICYVTFARSQDVILRELRAGFNAEYYEAFRERTVFKDFSSWYFRHSVVPREWTNQEDVFETPSGNVLEDLISFLDENADGAIVVLDSLTDLAIAETVEMKDLVTMVKGLQRVAKRWDGLVYLLLTRGILERKYEQMFMDSVDGCLAFEWKGYARSSNRQRYMYVEKFTSVLPHLPREKIARFPTVVTANTGLVVIYMERIA